VGVSSLYVDVESRPGLTYRSPNVQCSPATLRLRLFSSLRSLLGRLCRHHSLDDCYAATPVERPGGGAMRKTPRGREARSRLVCCLCPLSPGCAMSACAAYPSALYAKPPQDTAAASCCSPRLLSPASLRRPTVLTEWNSAPQQSNCKAKRKKQS